MIRAFFLSLGDLADPAILRVFVKSIALTLVSFLLLGAGLWFATRWLVIDQLGWDETAGNLAAISGFLAMLLFGWVLFRAIAVAVIWLFGDEIVAAVERRHYPDAMAAAQHVPIARSLALGLRSAGRAMLVNLLLLPAYVLLLVTGFGTPLLFYAANGWLLGADLGDMVAARHVAGGEMGGVAPSDAMDTLGPWPGRRGAAQYTVRQFDRAGARRSDGDALVSWEKAMKLAIGLGAGLLLVGCGDGTMARPAAPSAAPVRPISITGLDRVMGQNAAELTRTFGAPDTDIREGAARKLQFKGPICVLDTYLYPGKGSAQPTVTYVDTRQPNGSPIDRASCVAALARRGGGK